jgi:hypothetical protein
MKFRRRAGVPDRLATRRGFNESMRAWLEREVAPPTQRQPYFCECEDEQCTAVVLMTGAEFDAVRTQPAHFAVLPRYVRPGADSVVEKHDAYVVVEKNW